MRISADFFPAPPRPRASESLLFVLLLAVLSFQVKGAEVAVPDFTRGDPIPEGATHDWNLGPTGLRGWMHSERLVTTGGRQVRITKVDPGSPADGVLAVGDVLLGVGGKAFAFDPRTEIGQAVTAAETEAGAGKLVFTRWRAGKTEPVTVKIPVLGTYAATAPFACPKSKRIFDQSLRALAARVGEADYGKRHNPITRSLNALALLAGGQPEHLALLKKEAAWAAAYDAQDWQPWFYGYVLMFLAEYRLATGDSSVDAGMTRLALESARGQSAVGSWGHGFARPDGRLNGYGMMNAPGVPLTIGMTLAREAGVKDPALSTAINRSARLLRFYAGKGAVPYGDHHPWIETHEDNGKCGMAAVLFNLLGEAEPAAFFNRMSVASHGAERDGGHTGNFFNLAWAMPGVALGGPEATGAWMKEYGAWSLDLARRWDGTFLHQGPPEPKSDRYKDWDSTGVFILAYAQPLKKIALTGRVKPASPPLSAAVARGLIIDGRGWSNQDRTSVDAKRTVADLLERLGSWSPVVRERAALELGRRGKDHVPAVVALLESPRLETRLGACQALVRLRGAAEPAVPALRKALGDPNLWLRVQAADALAAIGAPSAPAVPELLNRLAQGPAKDDPRAMEQRFLSFAVFDTLPGKLLDEADRTLLFKAIAAGLRNEDGRSRSSVANVYKRFDYDAARPLLTAMREAIVTPSPSGEMFADGVRLRGCEFLAQHRVREGLDLTLDLVDLDRWGEANRTHQCLNIIARYGAAAKPVLPRLRALEQEMTAHKRAKNLEKAIVQIRELIKKIETAENPVELRALGI